MPVETSEGQTRVNSSTAVASASDIRTRLGYIVDIHPSPELLRSGFYEEYRAQAIDAFAEAISRMPQHAQDYILNSGQRFGFGDNQTYIESSFGETLASIHALGGYNDRARYVSSVLDVRETGYNPETGTMRFEIDKNGIYRAIDIAFHEIGHGIDAAVARADGDSGFYSANNALDGWAALGDMLNGLRLGGTFDQAQFDALPDSISARADYLRQTSAPALEVLYAGMSPEVRAMGMGRGVTPVSHTLSPAYFQNENDRATNSFGEVGSENRTTAFHTEMMAESLRHYYILSTFGGLEQEEIVARLRQLNPAGAELFERVLARANALDIPPVSSNDLLTAQRDYYAQMAREAAYERGRDWRAAETEARALVADMGQEELTQRIDRLRAERTQSFGPFLESFERDVGALNRYFNDHAISGNAETYYRNLQMRSGNAPMYSLTDLTFIGQDFFPNTALGQHTDRAALEAHFARRYGINVQQTLQNPQERLALYVAFREESQAYMEYLREHARAGVDMQTIARDYLQQTAQLPAENFLNINEGMLSGAFEPRFALSETMRMALPQTDLTDPVREQIAANRAAAARHVETITPLTTEFIDDGVILRATPDTVDAAALSAREILARGINNYEFWEGAPHVEPSDFRTYSLGEEGHYSIALDWDAYAARTGVSADQTFALEDGEWSPRDLYQAAMEDDILMQVSDDLANNDVRATAVYGSVELEADGIRVREILDNHFPIDAVDTSPMLSHEHYAAPRLGASTTFEIPGATPEESRFIAFERHARTTTAATQAANRNVSWPGGGLEPNETNYLTALRREMIFEEFDEFVRNPSQEASLHAIGEVVETRPSFIAYGTTESHTYATRVPNVEIVVEGERRNARDVARELFQEFREGGPLIDPNAQPGTRGNRQEVRTLLYMTPEQAVEVSTRAFYSHEGLNQVLHTDLQLHSETVQQELTTRLAAEGQNIEHLNASGRQLNVIFPTNRDAYLATTAVQSHIDQIERGGRVIVDRTPTENAARPGIGFRMEPVNIADPDGPTYIRMYSLAEGSLSTFAEQQAFIREAVDASTRTGISYDVEPLRTFGSRTVMPGVVIPENAIDGLELARTSLAQGDTIQLNMVDTQRYVIRVPRIEGAEPIEIRDWTGVEGDVLPPGETGENLNTIRFDGESIIAINEINKEPAGAVEALTAELERRRTASSTGELTRQDVIELFGNADRKGLVQRASGLARYSTYSPGLVGDVPWINTVTAVGDGLASHGHGVVVKNNALTVAVPVHGHDAALITTAGSADTAFITESNIQTLSHGEDGLLILSLNNGEVVDAHITQETGQYRLQDGRLYEPELVNRVNVRTGEVIVAQVDIAPDAPLAHIGANQPVADATNAVPEIVRNLQTGEFYSIVSADGSSVPLTFESLTHGEDAARIQADGYTTRIQREIAGRTYDFTVDMRSQAITQITDVATGEIHRPGNAIEPVHAARNPVHGAASGGRLAAGGALIQALSAPGMLQHAGEDRGIAIALTGGSVAAAGDVTQARLAQQAANVLNSADDAARLNRLSGAAGRVGLAFGGVAIGGLYLSAYDAYQRNDPNADAILNQANWGAGGMVGGMAAGSAMGAIGAGSAAGPVGFVVGYGLASVPAIQRRLEAGEPPVQAIGGGLAEPAIAIGQLIEQQAAEDERNWRESVRGTMTNAELRIHLEYSLRHTDLRSQSVQDAEARNRHATGDDSTFDQRTQASDMAIGPRIGFENEYVLSRSGTRDESSLPDESPVMEMLREECRQYVSDNRLTTTNIHGITIPQEYVANPALAVEYYASARAASMLQELRRDGVQTQSSANRFGLSAPTPAQFSEAGMTQNQLQDWADRWYSHADQNAAGGARNRDAINVLRGLPRISEHVENIRLAAPAIVDAEALRILGIADISQLPQGWQIPQQGIQVLQESANIPVTGRLDSATVNALLGDMPAADREILRTRGPASTEVQAIYANQRANAWKQDEPFVRALQTMCVQEGLLSETQIDGHWGNDTEAAMREVLGSRYETVTADIGSNDAARIQRALETIDSVTRTRRVQALVGVAPEQIDGMIGDDTRALAQSNFGIELTGVSRQGLISEAGARAVAETFQQRLDEARSQVGVSASVPSEAQQLLAQIAPENQAALLSSIQSIAGALNGVTLVNETRSAQEILSDGTLEATDIEIVMQYLREHPEVLGTEQLAQLDGDGANVTLNDLRAAITRIQPDEQNPENSR